jgi:hypothetical protein
MATTVWLSSVKIDGGLLCCDFKSSTWFDSSELFECLYADLDHVRVCDCSIWRRRGALNHRVEEQDFCLLVPIEELSLYQWHTKAAKDNLCLNCGILPFRCTRTAPHL